MLRWLIPYRYVPAVSDLDPDVLLADGITALIVDLDNTLVAWDAAVPTPRVKTWVAALRERGLRLCIVSNNFSGRARTIGDLLEVQVVPAAIKPAPWAFRRAMRLMGTAPAQTALVGDQLFTDVLGGNLIGLRTILVDPLSVQEFPTTKLVRAIERLLRDRVVRRVPHR